MTLSYAEIPTTHTHTRFQKVLRGYSLEYLCIKDAEKKKTKKQIFTMLSRNIKGFKVAKPLAHKYSSNPKEMPLRIEGQLRVNKLVHTLHKRKLFKS